MPGTIIDVVNPETLSSHYQPIISLKKKRIVGVEALARAKHPFTGQSIMPLQLFQLAEQENQLLELDRLCRRVAMEQYAPLLAEDPEMLLSINFDVSVLERGVLGSGVLQNMVNEAKLKPENIIIEINYVKIKQVEILKAFIDRHKSLGFLIALDNLGAEHTDLQRLAELKPDILKIARDLVHSLRQDFFKRQIFKSLVSLAHNVGALVVAQGVETESEVSTAMNLGADLFQGYYFQRPVAASSWNRRFIQETLEQCAKTNKQSIVKGMLSEREEESKQISLLGEIIEKLSAVNSENFDRILNGVVIRARELECLFVLDESGVQVTRTVTMQFMKGRSRGALFQPALPKTDHSMKDYYYGLMEAGLNRFMTPPYVSLASGNLCRTLAAVFQDSEKKNFVLCMDVKVA